MNNRIMGATKNEDRGLTVDNLHTLAVKRVLPIQESQGHSNRYGDLQVNAETKPSNAS